MLSAVARKSVTDLSRRRSRAALTVATIALAVASVGIFALPPMMDRAMETEVAANRLADVRVGIRPMPLAEDDLAGVPGVAAVGLRTTYQTRVLVGERRAQALLIGVPDFARQPVDVVSVRSGRSPRDGEALTDAQNARRDQYEGGTGDRLRVFDASGRLRSLRISGEGANLDGGQEVISERVVVLYAPAATVAAIAGEPGVDGLALRLRAGADSAAVMERVGRRLAGLPGFGGFTSVPEVRAAGDWPGRQELDDITTMFVIVTFLALLSGIMLVASTMNTLVAEQAGEIAAMKAVGARRRQIALVYLRTAFLLGLIGTLVGSVLGFAVANALVRFFGDAFFGISPGVGADPAVLLAGAVVGLAGPPLAAVPAILRGTRVTVREALQAAGPEVPGRAPRLDFLPRTVQIGVRNALTRWRRNLATVLQMMLAVATMLAVLGLSGGIAETVHGAWRDHGWNIWMGGESRPLDERAASLVASVPGVGRTEPAITEDVQVAGEDAFVWGTGARTMFRHRVDGGRWYRDGEERVGVIERGLARVTGAGVGDEVTVRAPTGPVRVRIVGIADNQQESGAVLFVPIATARSMMGMPPGSFGSLWIRTASPDHALIDRVSAEVEDRLVQAGYGADTEITYVAERDDEATYGTIGTTVTVLGLLIIAIGMVGLVNAITMSTLQRTREIGVLRCIGARSADVRHVFAGEGLVLVVAGWALGIPAGYALDRFLVWLVRDTIDIEVTFVFPPANVVLALVGTVLLALLALQLPLRRASRLRPGDALRVG